MKHSFLFFVFCFLLSKGTFSQYGFQKVYDHTEIDTFSIISDIYIRDSTPYITLGAGRGLSRSAFRFGSINEHGAFQSIIEYNDPGHYQRSMFSDVDTDTNFRGNLVNCYPDHSNRGNVFRLLEYGFNGTIYLDTVYTDFWTKDSLQFYDYSKLVHLIDSSYLINVNYTDKTQSNPEYNITGSLVLKIRYTGEIIEQLKIVNTFNPIKPTRVGRHLIKLNEDTFRLHYMEVMTYGGSNQEQSWARQYFLTTDFEGHVIDQKIFQDGQHCYSLYGTYFDEDTIYMQYFDSKLFYNSTDMGTQRFKYKPVIARIDENMDTVWRIPLSNSWFDNVSLSASIQKVRKVGNTSFIGAYKYLEEIIPHQSIVSNLRLLKFSSTGDMLWHRDYYYYEVDYWNDPEYEIKDLEIMPDGGFILGGQVRNGDLINAGEPGQFAYLLRTNCLGFLTPPEAAISYEREENEVLFVNNSLAAGSYTYYFGDGDTLKTGEGIDSVYHSYEQAGNYEVTLIAHGCNGEADSVQLLVTIDEPTGTVGDGVFSIYPNPLEQGGILTVQTGSIENATLHFYDMNGKMVKEVPLPEAKSLYFIAHNFATGVYQTRLIKDQEVLKEIKLVIH